VKPFDDCHDIDEAFIRGEGELNCGVCVCFTAMRLTMEMKRHANAVGLATKQQQIVASSELHISYTRIP
jgi:hypothetical protein